MNKYYDQGGVTIYQGHCHAVLRTLPDASAQCCITSPAYWGLRDYNAEGQLGLEKTPDEYVANLVTTFAEVRRVLRDDGTVFLNLGDTYTRDPTKGDRAEYMGLQKNAKAGGVHKASQKRTMGNLKPKDLCMIPARVALALQADGWYLRSDIIWYKRNPMPESVTDRPTKSHEHIFLLAKSQNYYYDHEAIKEPATYAGQPRGDGHRYNNGQQGFAKKIPYEMRNKRDVWDVQTKPYPKAHFATFPPKLIEPCVLAGCPEGGVVIDPFNGAGTTMVVARKNYRKAIGIELNPEYCEIAANRLAQGVLPLAGVNG